MLYSVTQFTALGRKHLELHCLSTRMGRNLTFVTTCMDLKVIVVGDLIQTWKGMKYVLTHLWEPHSRSHGGTQ